MNTLRTTIISLATYNYSMQYDVPYPICYQPYEIGKYLMVCYRECSAPQSVMFDEILKHTLKSNAAYHKNRPPCCHTRYLHAMY
jgi:hypothetical protein